jgi:hypothetical protein
VDRIIKAIKRQFRRSASPLDSEHRRKCFSTLFNLAAIMNIDGQMDLALSPSLHIKPIRRPGSYFLSQDGDWLFLPIL